jgi:adenylate cyclase
MKILSGVGMELVKQDQYAEEFLPPSGNLEAFMKLLKAYEYFYRFNREGNILARKEVEEGIALDPQYSKLYSGLALTHLFDLIYQSSESPEISFALATKNVKTALALDDEEWLAYITLGWLYLIRRDHDKAIAALERAITLNPNGADAHAQLGNMLAYSGRAEEGIKRIEKAMRLNPIPPVNYLQDLSYGYYSLGRYEDAIELNEMVLKRTPNNVIAHIGLAATYSALGRDEEASRYAEEILKLDPEFSLKQFAEILPIKEKAQLEQYISNLRKAGLK